MMEGDAFELSVEAEGQPQLRYQWLRAGVPLRTERCMWVPAAALTDAATYTCQVDIGQITWQPWQLALMLYDLWCTMTTSYFVMRRCQTSRAAPCQMPQLFQSRSVGSLPPSQANPGAPLAFFVCAPGSETACAAVCLVKRLRILRGASAALAIVSTHATHHIIVAIDRCSGAVVVEGDTISLSAAAEGRPPLHM